MADRRPLFTGLYKNLRRSFREFPDEFLPRHRPDSVRRAGEHNDFAFKAYDKDRLVLGKPMADWLA